MKRKISLEELINSNKEELLKDKNELTKIEERIETFLVEKTKENEKEKEEV